MKVSIVTISFNQAEFLEEAILSVLNQNYSDIEYIVVDPGSTDDSREIIEKYRDRISHIIYEPDKGPADGLNVGFKKATGDVYAYLNADDVFLHGSVKKMVNYFNQFPDVDVISGHAHVIVQNRNCWDGELMIDMALKGANFQVVNDFIGGFRLHDASISGSGRLEKQFLETQSSLRKRCIESNPNLERYVQNKVYRLYNRIRNPQACLLRLLDELLSHKGRSEWKRS